MGMQDWSDVLIITDLDGTLLPSNKKVSEKDIEAIREFQERGGKFAIATGRTLQAAKRYLVQLQPNTPVILFNGAAIYEPKTGEMLYTQELPEEAVSITRQVLEAFPDVSAEILRADGTYVTRMTSNEKEHLRICQVEPVLCMLDEVPKGEWLKVLFAISPERMRALQTYFHEKNWTCTDFVQSEARFYEMLPKGATKGSALRMYKSLCHETVKTIVAAGDFDNDLEMLQEADISACPSNAQPCVQKTVDIVLDHSCEESAIAELIQRIYEIIGGSRNG